MHKMPPPLSRVGQIQQMAVGHRRSARLATIGAVDPEFSKDDTDDGTVHSPGTANRPRLSSLSELPELSPPPETKKRTKKNQNPTTQAVEPSNEVAKTRPRSRPVKPEPVYVISDVEKKETKFRGRLGYACLNTILRNKKPADEAVFCSRTCRIETIKQKGLQWAKELARRNVQDLLTLIQWNEENNIRFMRISSDMFPFASHEKYGYPLTPYLPLLAEIGAVAKKYGHRLTTHPGQYVQLGSPSEKVLEASIRELKLHCELLDGMGIGIDGVCIIHGGGVYGDKPATLERLKATIRDILPKNVRDRLVLENDEICYNAEDLLPLCEELDIPLVFDHHHDAIYPSSISPLAIIARANAIFARRGIRPKQHVSEPRPGAVTLMERRAHADRVETIPDCGAEEIDLMIEAKDKEQAVLHLYRIYGLETVNSASLRPPAENQTKETKGRKSNKAAQAKARKQDAEEAADLDDEVGEETVVAIGRRTSKRSGSKSKRVADATLLEADDKTQITIEEEIGETIAVSGQVVSKKRRTRKKADVGTDGADAEMKEPDALEVAHAEEVAATTP